MWDRISLCSETVANTRGRVAPSGWRVDFRVRTDESWRPPGRVFIQRTAVHYPHDNIGWWELLVSRDTHHLICGPSPRQSAATFTIIPRDPPPPLLAANGFARGRPWPGRTEVVAVNCSHRSVNCTTASILKTRKSFDNLKRYTLAKLNRRTYVWIFIIFDLMVL